MSAVPPTIESQGLGGLAQRGEATTRSHPANAGSHTTAPGVTVPLPFAELDRLHREFHRGRDPRVRDRLVNQYVGLARRLALRFANRGEPFDDLVQVAMIGVLKALDRYDPALGVRFPSFATPTILGELKRYFRDRAWALRVPRRLQEVYLQMKQAVSALSQELGRSPTLAEIAERTGASEEELIEASDAGHNFYALSLDAPSPVDGEQSLDPGETDDGMDRAEARVLVRSVTDRLGRRERVILHLRFERGLTQREIADGLGMSQMQVSRVLARTLDRLRAKAAG